MTKGITYAIIYLNIKHLDDQNFQKHTLVQINIVIKMFPVITLYSKSLGGVTHDIITG